MKEYFSRSLLCGLILSGCFITLGINTQAQNFPTRETSLGDKFEFDGMKFNATNIAGENSGEQTVTLGPTNGKVNGEPVALAGIWIDETGDEPCAIRVTFRDINSPDSGAIAVHPYTLNLDNRCSINAQFWQTGEIFWENEFAGTYALETQAVRPTNRWSLHSLKVCSNERSSERGKLVKGMQASFVDQDPENGLTPVPGLVVAKQPNCKEDWLARGTSACPDDSVAMGLRVVTQEIGNKQSITGLGLVCRKVKRVALLRPVRDPIGR